MTKPHNDEQDVDEHDTNGNDRCSDGGEDDESQLLPHFPALRPPPAPRLLLCRSQDDVTVEAVNIEGCGMEDEIGKSIIAVVTAVVRRFTGIIPKFCEAIRGSFKTSFFFPSPSVLCSKLYEYRYTQNLNETRETNVMQTNGIARVILNKWK